MWKNRMKSVTLGALNGLSNHRSFASYLNAESTRNI